MQAISDISELDKLYKEPVPTSLTKVCSSLTPLYRKWIEMSQFVVLSTVGPEGTDGSPRGDDGPVVAVQDSKTLLIPDWRGNNRLDSLRNIVRDGRVSLMFMVPGSENVVRVNGSAVLTADASICARFEKAGKLPCTVICVTIEELYFQCAKAIMRSGLWTAGDQSSGLPTAGQFVKEKAEDFDAESYDSGYAEYAKPRLW